MLKRIGMILTASVVALVCDPVAAHAQGAFVTPFIGSVFGGDVPSTRATYGGAIAAMGPVFGAELEFGYTPTLFEVGNTDANLLTLTVNALASLPLGRLHPYGTAGIGLMRQQTSVSLPGFLNDITDNDFGYSVGGGAWVMFTDHVGLRGDVRFFQIRKTDGFNFGRGTGGLILAF
jgi:opacity protein-like surface antigen